ncbi:phospholipase A2 isoform X2 [Eurytemora carolleeae]|uniref:phospholipase A2 isoform X2 n=1 Tax=Eurytemora carolleeae TaxID=1294199 RepID=UPI000C75D823|nr:phospholipase A2 isoform X2 [Eurytemora carolleeae]|eukprot:XP_023342172.1 phospholipase A2-like isoform X2 [Eurytemora affinis]
MNLSFLFFVPIVLAGPGLAVDDNQRSIIQLALMVAESIDCSFPYFPIPYGCWCGITIPYPPVHEEPVDEFDATCKVHDHCYDDAVEYGCDWLDEYVWSYDWDFDENNVITCSEDQDICQKMMCNCDKAVAEALKETAAEYGCPASDPGCPEEFISK